MPIQHSPPERQTGSQARTQATEDPFWKEQQHPGVSRTIFRGPGEDGEEEEENCMEEEESDGTKGVPAHVGESQDTGGPTLSQSYQPVSHESEPSLLDIMQKMSQIMPNVQEASSSEASRLHS
ncbi:hypothetical protein O181_042449 [Austropuccinia psidii MF-1]|uniref:Uncharacterized protein n=1 Tax=Austropuccinia psidii MF-1 TaxID=1389203 RepID=A0A9Q3HHH2_9BASI|nr:hypothetical protein [Austropuccinia psidii MF-1]